MATGIMTVQTGFSAVSRTVASIIFIEKRRSFPASLPMRTHWWSLGRTRNVFLMKMDALRRYPSHKGSLSELPEVIARV